MTSKTNWESRAGVRGGRGRGNGEDKGGKIPHGDFGFEDAGGFGAGRFARDQASGCSGTGASADGIWIGGRCRSRDERRRVRFSAEAGGPGAFEAPGAEGGTAAGVTAGESAAARRILHALRISADRGGACLDPGSEPADPESGGDGFDLPAAG